MAEQTQIVFKYKEVVEALLKHNDIHEGIWGIFVRFGLQAHNIGPSEDELIPAAIVPLLEIGLQKFEKESNISVDASKVNPQQLPVAELK